MIFINFVYLYQMNMLNISFLACTKVESLDQAVCNVDYWRKILKSRSDLDLCPTMPNIELVRDIFIYNVFKFNIPRSITF